MAIHEFDADFLWIELHGGEPTCSGLPVAGAPFPPRPASEISELASSVRLHGVLSPVLLRRRGDTYQVVAGWSRLRAAQSAGLERIPAIARDLEDAAAIRAYLSTKAVRKALTPETQQKALRALKDLRSAPAPDGSPGLEPLENARRFRVPAGRPRGREERGGARSPLAPRSAHRSVAAAPDGAGAARALRDATEELFFEVQSTRRLDAARVEGLVDRLFLLVETRSALDLAQLYEPPLENVVSAHSVAVALLAAYVGRSLGWGKTRSRQFVVAALLHDVGMVFLAEDLRHQGRLDPRAREALPRHATVGHAVIESAGAWPIEVARCARDHHERWDGSGYPRGCRGGTVSYGARLLAYLDTFAALVSPRPHRSALAPHIALRRLKAASEAGKLDPELLTPVTSILSRLAIVPVAPTADARRPPGEKTVELPDASVTMPRHGARSAGVRS